MMILEVKVIELTSYFNYKGILLPNEPEFRSYFLLTHIEKDVLQNCSQMTSDVLSSPQVQFTLKVIKFN